MHYQNFHIITKLIIGSILVVITKEMVLKNLNDVSIYIVPLLDDNLTWNDLTVESGYINAYTTDKIDLFRRKGLSFI